MSDVKNSLVDGAGDASLEVIAARLRKVRIGVSVFIVVVAASLVASMMEYPVPVTFVLAVFSIGGLSAVGMSFSRNINVGTFEGFLYGPSIVSWLILGYLLFPTWSGNLLAICWSGMSAWMLGFSALTLPLVRFSSERKRKAMQTQQASVQRYRDSGDSAFVAGLRTSAGKWRKGYLITLIAIAAVMGGLGMYTWLFLDLLLGLLLALMMLPPIAMFAWLLKLREGAVR